MANAINVEVNHRFRAQSGYVYRVCQELGSGGNSVVYLVVAQSGPYRGVLFALKVFTKIRHPDRLTRFKIECEFLRGASHPAVMRVYDNGVYTEVDADGTTVLSFPFAVVEYLPTTLGDLLRGRVSTVERVAYALQLLSGLAFLASQSPAVVHRDIKPANIFVKGRSCVLGDFGLMKLLNEPGGEVEGDRDLLVESVGPGMPWRYRTPDLVAYTKNGVPVTCASDVFQLGLVLAEAFTGKNPLRKAGNKLDPVVLDPIGEVSGSQGRGIRSLIESMLHENPTKRPSAQELVEAWEGIFREVYSQALQLDGTVF